MKLYKKKKMIIFFLLFGKSKASEIIDQCPSIPIRRQSKHFPKKTLPNFKFSPLSIILQSSIKNGQRKEILNTSRGTVKEKRKSSNVFGSYYGIRDDIFFDKKDDATAIDDVPESKKGLSYDPSPTKDTISSTTLDTTTSTTLVDVMGQTLLELREMREDISALREEMHSIKNHFEFRESNRYDNYGSKNKEYDNQKHSQQRKRDFEATAQEVEKWAEDLLAEEGEENGWNEVMCNKMVKNKYNRHGTTRCHIKYMRDPRVKQCESDDDDQLYPCIRCHATINATMDMVCEYLSDETKVPEYNDLVIQHKCIEDITPQSKISWGVSPQILFVKSRDFVTYCHYRWRNDGTQIIVNQACDHEDYPSCNNDSNGKICRAMALRGANFISPDPDDPNKTRFSLLALAQPGGGIPNWALKTAVNALAPIEPFKLFAKIEKNVNNLYTEDDKSHAKTTSNKLDKRSRPAGLSQLGYACFWPNGINGASSNQNHDSIEKVECREMDTDISDKKEYYDSCVDMANEI